MSNQLNPGTAAAAIQGPPNPEHNVAEQKEILSTAAAVCSRIEAEIASLREDLKAAKAPVKKFMSMSAFNAARKVANLEDDDRYKRIDELKLAYETLLPGQTADMFPGGVSTAVE